MSLTVENKTIGLAVTPPSASTLTLDIEVPSVITLEMPASQGISGVYGSTEYSVRVEQVDANNIYRGEAEPGSSESMTVWRIQKIVITGTTTTVLWAGGSKTFINRWTDRASLSYS